MRPGPSPAALTLSERCTTSPIPARPRLGLIAVRQRSARAHCLASPAAWRCDNQPGAELTQRSDAALPPEPLLLLLFWGGSMSCCGQGVNCVMSSFWSCRLFVGIRGAALADVDDCLPSSRTLRQSLLTSASNNIGSLRAPTPNHCRTESIPCRCLALRLPALRCTGGTECATGSMIEGRYYGNAMRHS